MDHARPSDCYEKWAPKLTLRRRPVGGQAKRCPVSNEAGLSLIETIIAIALAGILLVAGLAGLTSMMLTNVVARENQASAEVLEQEVERIRGVAYAAVAMVEADLNDGPGGILDPAITRTGTSPNFEYWFDHDDNAGTPRERIIVAAGGAISDHRSTVTRNNTTYALSVYVTNPADASGDYRRVTVRAEWGNNPVHRREATTFVTETRRGLPLPKFRFGDPITITVTAGTNLVLPATLTNRGARDSFSLASSTAPPVGWTFTWYADTNGNGALDPGEGDPGDELTTTAPMETDDVLRLLLVAPVPAAEATATKVVTLTATSVAQPSVFETFNDTVNVQAVGCGAPCTRYFKNTAGPPANSTRKTNMPVTPTGPTGAGPFNFDTDIDSDPGRLVSKGGSGDGEADAAKMANWRYQVANDVTFNGTAKVRIYATMKSYVTPRLGKLNIYVRKRTSSSCLTGAAGTYTLVASGTHTIDPWPTSFTLVEVSIPVNFSLAANRCFEIKVVVDGSSEDDMWIAYETASAPAKVEMPVTAGVM